MTTDDEGSFVPYNVGHVFDVVLKNKIASSLIQIAMRQCWMEDFELALQFNPTKTGVIALIFGHLDLAWKLINDLKVFDVNAMSDGDVFTCLVAIGQQGKFEFLKLLEDRRQNWDDILRDNLSMLLALAMEYGQVHILRYIEPMLEEFQIIDTLRYRAYGTEHLDCWEWSRKYNLTPITVPEVKNLTQAQFVVAKFGRNKLTYDIINYAALNIDFEVFDCLWSHRSDHFWDYNHFQKFQFEEIAKARVNSKTARIFLLEFYDVKHERYINLSLEAVTFLHTHKPQSSKWRRIFVTAVDFGNIAVVEFLLQHGAVVLEDCLLDRALRFQQIRVAEILYDYGCRFAPDGFDIDQAALTLDLDVVKLVQRHFSMARCTSKAMNRAARCGHFEMVKFLNENRSEGCVETAMVEAARKADYDIVVYLFENRREDCDMERVLAEAMKSGSLRLVRFLFDNGVSLDCEGINGEIEEELADFVNEDIAELVPRHLSVTD
ncbi:hypothetical protein HDU76_004951 [Blyttiomyces sp. JEL0837]|nr:hypothetical protein HDU76_004951 [Blyttiomyces sp. JEL0837]